LAHSDFETRAPCREKLLCGEMAAAILQTYQYGRLRPLRQSDL